MTQRSVKRAVAKFAAGVAVLNCLACAGVLIPPARASVATGPAVGSISTTLRHSDGTPQTGQSVTPAVAAVSETRVGFYPQGLMDTRRHRRWDVGAGYGYTQFYGARGAGLAPVGGYHSVFFSGVYYPWLSSRTHGDFARWGIHFDLDIPLADDTLRERLGIATTVATTLEWVGFANGSGGGGDAEAGGGYATYGEGAIGLRFAMSAYDVDGQAAWSATAGINVVLPTFAGGVYAPVAVLEGAGLVLGALAAGR